MSNEPGNIYRLRPEEGSPGVERRRHPRDRSGKNDHSSRMKIGLVVLALLGIILASQLVRYQAFGVIPSSASPEDKVVDRSLPRGNIVDRNGHPLAIESYQYRVIAEPAMIDDPDAFAESVAPMLGLDDAQVAKDIRDNENSWYLPLADEVGPALGEKIIATRTPALHALPQPVRYYPEGSLACHIIGFVGYNRVGNYGLEGFFDEFLRAPRRSPQLLDPPALAEADAGTGTELPESEFVPSYVQQDLVLTLDRMIQHIAETELEKAVDKYRAEGGSIIVLEPDTSAVLAMASWPRYNPNRYGLVKDNTVYINPAISDLYEPGSVFKLITFAAALENEVITPETKYLDEKEFFHGQRKIQNWDRKGYGTVPTRYALAKSLNVTTAKIAVDVGAREFYRAVHRFGFGQHTGIELDNEAPGIVKEPEKNDWYPADLATNAFGQGISVTPLQMANAIAAIASGGVLHRTHLVQQIVDGEELRITKPQAKNRAISELTSKTLTDMMVYTVQQTEEAQIEGYTIAGKTGTAEIPLAGGYIDERTYVSFGGFFPADDPQFVILVKLDRPQASKWATKTAAPLFRTVAKQLIRLYAIPPDNIRLSQAGHD